jgi:thiamine-phosphate pyrophosphorylase
VITDLSRTTVRDLPRTVARALEGAPRGQVGLQLRAKELAGRELLHLVEELGEVTRAAGAALLVNDRVDVALAGAADGVHLPARGLPVADARRLLGPERLIGVSTHAPAEIEAARAAGADFAVFGPVFFTPSKAHDGPPHGLAGLTAATAIALPVFALGGIEAHNAGACRRKGAHGVAFIRAVFEASDPARAVASILHAFDTELDHA